MLEDLEHLIGEAMAEWQIPGLAIALVHGSDAVEMKGYGRRDVEADLPVTTDTQFRLCSITKSFTAAGLGTLVNEGRLKWSSHVRDFLPEFRLHERIADDEVKIRDLLSHHSGVPPHEWVWMPGDLSREQMLASLRYLEPSCGLRECFQYLNLGYLALGLVAERIGGQSWEDFTRERVLAPLGIRKFSFSRDYLEQEGDAARPYAMIGSQCQRARMWPIRDTPAGGLNTSIAGLARWVQCLLGGGCCDDVRVLSNDVVQAMQAPRVYAGPAKAPNVGHLHYGFGLASHSYRGEWVVGHSGDWIGWGALMMMLPERGLGVAVLTNRDPSPGPEVVAYAALDLMCGRDRLPWLQRQRAHEAEGRKQSTQADRLGQHVPNRPLTDYAGVYKHPAYGRMTILVRGEALLWSWRGMHAQLDHRHYDVFSLPARAGELFPQRLSLTFGYDGAGAISWLMAPLEPKVSDIRFDRVANAQP